MLRRADSPAGASVPLPESGNARYRQKEKAPRLRAGPFFLFDAWQFPTLAWGDPTLPSALRRFTSEFGMGSGGTTALKPPGKFCYSYRHQAVQINPVQAENIMCLSDTHQNASGVVRLSLTGH